VAAAPLSGLGPVTYGTAASYTPHRCGRHLAFATVSFANALSCAFCGTCAARSSSVVS